MERYRARPVQKLMGYLKGRGGNCSQRLLNGNLVLSAIKCPGCVQGIDVCAQFVPPAVFPDAKKPKRFLGTRPSCGETIRLFPPPNSIHASDVECSWCNLKTHFPTRMLQKAAHELKQCWLFSSSAHDCIYPLWRLTRWNLHAPGLCWKSV